MSGLPAQSSADAHQASLPSKSFSTLPTEIQRRILHFLDRRSLCAVARGSRLLSSLAESSLWQHLDFTSVTEYGEAPRVVPSPINQRLCKADLPLMIAHEQHLTAARAELGKIVVKEGGKRWSMVEEVTASGTAESAELLMVVLRMTAPRLKELHVEGYRVPPAKSVIIPAENKMIDVLLYRSDLCFPSLTHVTIGPASYCLFDFIPLLFSRAPNVLVLDANLDRCKTSGSSSYEDPTIPPLVGPTRLRSLRVVAGNPDSPEIDLATEIVCASPALRQLIVRLWPDDHEANSSSYLHIDDWKGSEWQDKPFLALQGHPVLRDLYWPTDTILYEESIGPDVRALDSLARLVVRCDWVDTFDWLFKLPNLQQLFLDCSRPTGATHREIRVAPAYTFPIELQLRFCGFADTLRNYPKLQILHTILDDFAADDFTLLDQLDICSAHPMGRVGSMRHGVGEVVCSRLLVCFEEVEDKSWTAISEGEWDDISAAREQERLAAWHPQSEWDFDTLVDLGASRGVRYTARDGSMRERIYARLPEPAWRVLCDYEGLPVPPEVIQGMRDVEGMEAEVWEKRGIWVGEAAWKILTEWYEGCMAESAGDSEHAYPEEVHQGSLSHMEDE